MLGTRAQPTIAYEDEIDLILKGVRLQRESFDVVVGAGTVREVKPHLHAFRYAVEKLEVKPEETLFVGDSFEIDYRLSEEIGLKVVFMRRRDSNPKNQNIRGIRNLHETFRFIDQNS